MREHPITRHLKAAKAELKELKKADHNSPEIPVVRQRVASLQAIVDRAHSFTIIS